MHSLFPVLFLLNFARPAVSLICYSCTTTLSANIDENAQVALRLFLNSVYELPPVHRFCNMEQDVEFKTITTVQCSTPNDQCVKVRAENDGLEFVIRGCKSRVYKTDVGIPQNVHCRQGSPSLCFCKENLCNSALSATASMATTIFMIIFIILMPNHNIFG
ncbi:hypothetical protein niasHT_001593 [Heterodera trifolii]|uniref:Protein sleepless n=1 Tax=Heterodera trifolii TaxID=157864 RepID=A0ABD2MB68_9BILA